MYGFSYRAGGILGFLPPLQHYWYSYTIYFVSFPPYYANFLRSCVKYHVKPNCEYFSLPISLFLSVEVAEKPPALQLLMLIPEAIDVSSLFPPPSPSPSLQKGLDDKLSVPNCYLICKLFCAKPHPHTPVQWASKNPQFGFKQVTNSLLILYILQAYITYFRN